MNPATRGQSAGTGDQEPSHEARVSIAASRTRETFADTTPPLTNHIVFARLSPGGIYFAFKTKADLAEAERSKLTNEIKSHAQKAMTAAGIRSKVAKTVRLTFVSEEEIDEAGGPWIAFR